MISPALERFISQAVIRSREQAEPADCVLALAPLMLDLIDQAGTFLEPQHFRSDPGATRETSSMTLPTKACRCIRSSGSRGNGRRFTITEAGAWSA